MKKLLSISAALEMAATLTACSNSHIAGTGSMTVDQFFEFNGGFYSGTYTGDVVSNVPSGNGTFTGSDSTDSRKITASGEWYVVLNGQGEVTVEFLNDDRDWKFITLKGKFDYNVPVGKVEIIYYLTDEDAASYGFDRMVATGTYDSGKRDLVKPYNAKSYKGSTLVNETVVE